MSFLVLWTTAKRTPTGYAKEMPPSDCLIAYNNNNDDNIVFSKYFNVCTRHC